MNRLFSNSFRAAVMGAAADTFWRLPGCFEIVRLLGPSYALRCLVFHDVSGTDSPFTRGMGVRISPARFETALKFLTAYYTPVSLEEMLSAMGGSTLPDRAVLVTFDDGYASAAQTAAPLCLRYGVPATFFINAAFLDNHRLAPDNLVCYVANMLGMDALRTAAMAVLGPVTPELHSLNDAFSIFLPKLSLQQRELFLDALRRAAGIDESTMAREAEIYMSSRQLRDLGSWGFEIGNHTYSHAHCRSLSREDLVSELGRNKAELEAITGQKVRSFSQPYGSSEDLTPELAEHLTHSGCRAVFLSESVANRRGADPFHLDRVSTLAGKYSTLFFELEALPRLRAIRDRFFDTVVASRRNPLPSLSWQSIGEKEELHKDRQRAC
jgi:peptidoglycan/xylan/chitin deacetylase (PgdA/CDA1 family)